MSALSALLGLMAQQAAPPPCRDVEFGALVTLTGRLSRVILTEQIPVGNRFKDGKKSNEFYLELDQPICTEPAVLEPSGPTDFIQVLPRQPDRAFIALVAKKVKISGTLVGLWKDNATEPAIESKSIKVFKP